MTGEHDQSPPDLLVALNVITCVAFIGLASAASYFLQLRDDTACAQKRVRSSRVARNRTANYVAAHSGLESRQLDPSENNNNNSNNNPDSLSPNYYQYTDSHDQRSTQRISAHRVNNSSFHTGPTSEDFSFIDQSHFSESDTESVCSHETDAIVQEQRQRDERKPLIEDIPTSGSVTSTDGGSFSTPVHRKQASSSLSIDNLNHGSFPFCCLAGKHRNKPVVDTEMFQDNRTIFFIFVMVSCIVQAVTLVVFTLSVDLAQYSNRKKQDLVTSPQAFTVFAVFITLLVTIHALVTQEIRTEEAHLVRSRTRFLLFFLPLLMAIVYAIVDLLEKLNVLSPIHGEYAGTFFSGSIALAFLYSAYYLPKQLSQFGTLNNELRRTTSRLRRVCIIVGVWLLIRLVVYFPLLQDKYASLQAYPPVVFDFIDMLAIGMSMFFLHSRRPSPQ